MQSVATEQTTVPGTRVATVGRDGARHTGHCPIWTGKVYEARRRKSDGVLTWHLVSTFGGTRSGVQVSAKYRAEIIEAASAMGLQFVGGIRQGKRCE